MSLETELYVPMVDFEFIACLHVFDYVVKYFDLIDSDLDAH